MRRIRTSRMSPPWGICWFVFKTPDAQGSAGRYIRAVNFFRTYEFLYQKYGSKLFNFFRHTNGTKNNFNAKVRKFGNESNSNLRWGSTLVSLGEPQLPTKGKLDCAAKIGPNRNFERLTQYQCRSNALFYCALLPGKALRWSASCNFWWDWRHVSFTNW